VGQAKTSRTVITGCLVTDDILYTNTSPQTVDRDQINNITAPSILFRANKVNNKL